MEIKVLTGNAFDSGGRLEICSHTTAGATRVLIDRSPMALIALRRAGLDPNVVEIGLLSSRCDEIGAEAGQCGRVER